MFDEDTNCSKYVDVYPDLLNTHAAKIIFGLIYTILFIFGLLGNCAIIYTTAKHVELRTLQNVLIANLAIADILMCIICIPTTAVTYVYKEWYFGAAMCRLLPLCQGASIFISTFTMTAIAIHRYTAVVKPKFPKPTIPKAIAIVIVIWIGSNLIVMPYSINIALTPYGNLCGVYCSEAWGGKIQKSYGFGVLILQFIIPFIIMVYCYSNVLNTLNSHVQRKVNRILSVRSERRLEILKRHKQSTMILISMVAIFVLAWLPFNIVIILDDLIGLSTNSTYGYLPLMVTYAFAMITVLSNPILYAWLNFQLRGFISQTFSVERRERLPSTRFNEDNTKTATRGIDTTHRRSEQQDRRERSASFCRRLLDKAGPNGKRIEETRDPGNKRQSLLSPNWSQSSRCHSPMLVVNNGVTLELGDKQSMHTRRKSENIGLCRRSVEVTPSLIERSETDPSERIATGEINEQLSYAL